MDGDNLLGNPGSGTYLLHQEFKQMNKRIYFKDNWMLIPYTRALRYIFQVHQKWNTLNLSQAVQHLFPNQDIPPELYIH